MRKVSRRSSNKILKKEEKEKENRKKENRKEKQEREREREREGGGKRSIDRNKTVRYNPETKNPPHVSRP